MKDLILTILGLLGNIGWFLIGWHHGAKKSVIRVEKAEMSFRDLKVEDEN